MSCIIVFGTAFLIPKWATASTNLLWSCGVHTRRGRLRVRAGSSDPAAPPAPPPPPAAPLSSGESNSADELGWDERAVDCGGCGGGGGGVWWRAWWGFGMLKACARSGVIRDWDKGISSSGEGNSSSHLENQLESSSLIFFLSFQPHLDITPPNFLLWEEKEPKILFFLTLSRSFRTENNEIYNQVSGEGKKFVLCGYSRKIKRERNDFLGLMKFLELEGFFNSSLSIKKARRTLRERERERGAAFVFGGRRCCLVWRGDRGGSCFLLFQLLLRLLLWTPFLMIFMCSGGVLFFQDLGVLFMLLSFLRVCVTPEKRVFFFISIIFQIIHIHTDICIYIS